MKKPVKIVGIIMGVIVLLIVLLCTVPITSSKLKDLALAKAKPILGREVTIERVRIILLRGIRLDGITIANREGFAKQPLFEGKRIVVKYELLPLLRKELIIKKVILLEPKILLERNKKGEWNFSGIGKKVEASPTGQPEQSGDPDPRLPARRDGSTGLTLTISQVAIKKGEITLEDRSKAAPLKSLKTGLDLTSSIEMKGGIAAKGKISLNDLIVQLNPTTKKPLKISKFEIPYEFKDNQLTIKDLKVLTCQGELKVEAKIDFEKTEYNLKVIIEKMEINDLLSSLTTTKDMVYGTLATELEIEAKGQGEKLMKNARGKGFVNLARGRISGLPLQKNLLGSLSSALPISSLEEIPYNSLGGHFTLRESKIKIEDFELDGDLMKISAHGVYSLSGSLDFEIVVKTTPKLIKSSAIPVFLRNEEGNASLPFEVKGTAQDSKFKPKWEKMIKKIIGKTIKEELGKVLPEGESGAAQELLKGLGGFFKKK